MTNKTTISIYIDEDIAKEAKEIGLNISKLCKNCLKQAICPKTYKNPDGN